MKILNQTTSKFNHNQSRARRTLLKTCDRCGSWFLRIGKTITIDCIGELRQEELIICDGCARALTSTMEVAA
jgi:hypothetical protein